MNLRVASATQFGISYDSRSLLPRFARWTPNVDLPVTGVFRALRMAQRPAAVVRRENLFPRPRIETLNLGIFFTEFTLLVDERESL